MKKTILALLMSGTSCAVFAQDSLRTQSTNSSATMSTTNTMDQTGSDSLMSQSNTLSSDTSYNAYSAFTATAPDYMQGYVLRDYPTATDIRWRQTGDWWHGYSLNNGVPTNMYYNSAGQTFTVALPVRQSLVPDAVVSKAVEMYGPTLYDVNVIKGTNKQDVYHVRIIENGTIASHYVDDQGNSVIDIYREETVDPAAATTGTYMSSDANSAQSASTDMNTTSGTNEKLKIKTKKSDGTESKLKVKNGKVKTKGY